jgi:HEPN domain-containing protein
MSSHSEQAKALLDAAQRDLITLKVLLKDSESPIETTLFHAQQMHEKCVKAALVVAGVVFPRTHDLLELLEFANNSGLQLPASRDLMARLSPYAVEFRYLGVIAPTVALDEAWTSSKNLMAWVKALIESKETP